MKLNGKRIFLYFMILLVIALFCVMFVACNVDDVKEISVTPDTINVRIGEFNYSDYTVTATYNSGKTEESVLKEDMISPSDRLKFFQEGEHEIVVNYLNKSTTIKVNVRRNVFEGVEFEDLDVVYNGEFYTLEVKNVPEGTTVTYASTNRFRTAGEYQVTAILRKDAYEMKEMTATITIRKADYDLSGISFEDKTEDYDAPRSSPTSSPTRTRKSSCSRRSARPPRAGGTTFSAAATASSGRRACSRTCRSSCGRRWRNTTPIPRAST